MNLFAATCFFILSTKASVVFSANIRGAALKKEHNKQESVGNLSALVDTKTVDKNDQRSLIFGWEDNKNDEDSLPDFLLEEDLPPGLVDNPSQALGVDLKPGRVPRGQKVPNLTQKKKAILRGLDNRPIKLDLDTSERINVYDPDRYSVSSDGSYVTDIETEQVIKLNVFHASDDKNQVNVMYSLDEDGYVNNVRITPKISKDKKGEIQNFQRLSKADALLVGYTDDDMDLSNAPALQDVQIPEEDSAEGDGENRRTRRRTQSKDPLKFVGKTCYVWDRLDVRIVTDQKFKDDYSDPASKALEVVAAAAAIYWESSCVFLLMAHESTVGNSNWNMPNGNHIDNILSASTVESALGILADTIKLRQPNANRDAWHLFSGANFSGGVNTIGSAYINTCRSKDYGYAVNKITFTTNLRLQAVLFAHELGHNIGLNDSTSTPENWVMEPSINSAPENFTPANAIKIEDMVVHSDGCGWY